MVILIKPGPLGCIPAFNGPISSHLTLTAELMLECDATFEISYIMDRSHSDTVFMTNFYQES